MQVMILITLMMMRLAMINLLSLVITGFVEGVGGHNQRIRDCPDIHPDQYHHHLHHSHHYLHHHYNQVMLNLIISMPM